MESVCALALCLLFSLCSATSPPKLPVLTPLNCNETKHQIELAADLINEDREEGFIIRPVRTNSIFEQRVEKVAGASLYYVDFDVKETKCSVLSKKKWKNCDEEVPFHEEVGGVCKAIIYIARPWRILKLLTFNCTLGTVPSSDIALRCPDCPVAIRTITPTITEKAKHLVEKFNQDSNQTNHFKVDNIERVSSQWVFGTNYFFHFTTKETDCVKTQKAEKGKAFNLDNCNSLKDHEAHVGFCLGSSFTTPEKTEDYTVSCEIYDPVDDDHHHSHHHKHGSCDHGKEGAKVEKSKDNVEAGAGKTGADEAAAGEKQVLPVKCELGKGKHCGQHKGLRHHCHPGRHHHHHHHPGHHHHHHHHHDHQNHSHPHDPAHHHHDHHNHTNAEHGSSSEETTDKQPFKRVKGSVQVFYLDEETPSPPVPTIFRLPKPGKDVPETADFPHEPSPLTTCPSSSW